MDSTRKLLWWNASLGIHWSMGIHNGKFSRVRLPVCRCIFVRTMPCTCICLPDLMQLTLRLHAQPSGIPKPIHRAFQLLHAAGSSQLEVVAGPGGTCDNATTVLAIANTSSTTAGELRSPGLMIFLSNTGRGNCTVTLAGLPNTESAWLHTIDSTSGNPYGLWQKMGAHPFPTPTELRLLRSESDLQPLKLRIADSQPTLFELEPNALQVLVI